MASTHEALVDTLRRTAAALPDVDLLVLFGSRAGSSARADSDIDLAIGLPNHSAEVRRAVEVAFARAVHARADVVFLKASGYQRSIGNCRRGAGSRRPSGLRTTS